MFSTYIIMSKAKGFFTTQGNNFFNAIGKFSFHRRGIRYCKCKLLTDYFDLSSIKILNTCRPQFVQCGFADNATTLGEFGPSQNTRSITLSPSANLLPNTCG